MFINCITTVDGGGGLMSAFGAVTGNAGPDNMVQKLQKAMELDEVDKDTLHLLSFLFMKFLAQFKHVISYKIKFLTLLILKTLMTQH